MAQCRSLVEGELLQRGGETEKSEPSGCGRDDLPLVGHWKTTILWWLKGRLLQMVGGEIRCKKNKPYDIVVE